jgi:hypothetical protein
MPRRVRLRQLIANANAKVNQAGGVMQNTNELLDFAEEVMDGVTLTVVHQGEGTLMDFFSGKIKELPIGIKLTIDEDDLPAKVS